jgi:large subunit ribosomal protein L13
MPNLTRSTKPLKEKEIKREWHLLDAKGKILGRFATKVARFLIGKHKLDYVPYLDMGDYVVVINAKGIVVSGRKEKEKLYSRYSGYPGGLKKITFKKLKENKPEEIIKHAVSGMLPKNKLRDRRLARLFIFADENHSYRKKFRASKIENSC